MVTVMFSEKELHDLHQDVFERMLKAGWLANFTYTKAKGWHLGWTMEGSPRAIALKHISVDHALADTDLGALGFDILSRGACLDARFSVLGEIDEKALGVWKTLRGRTRGFTAMRTGF